MLKPIHERLSEMKSQLDRLCELACRRGSLRSLLTLT
jgi:hypothetical protein